MLNEDTLSEQPVIEWLKEMGYEYAFGPDIGVSGAFAERMDHRNVILETRLKRSLKRINPDILDDKLEIVANQLIKYSHQDLELGNKEMYEMLVSGLRVEIKDKNNNLRGRIVKPIDFDHPDNNEFLVVNQFSVQTYEKTIRIPDVVVFINGIPVALFELKSPTRENATIVDAYSQINDFYKKEIPKIFYYNQILVIADLTKARYGTVSSGWDFFTPWKRIENEDEKNLKNKSELEILTKGVFKKERLLDLIQNFTVFEADAEQNASKYTKKIAMYHQYFGVNRAVEKTLTAVKTNRQVGVFWHTQGSGKSISMVFYVNKLRKLEELKGPTALFLADRNDLDKQLYKTFLRCGYPTAKQAGNIGDLIEKIKSAGSEILFTTIQKFDFSEPLNQRDNFIVIADEAHRSQYADFAANVRVALPNASFMGITGTPIELNNKNTRLVFGDYVSKYTIDQSEKDKTTVRIYYEGRLTPLHISDKYIDEIFDKFADDLTIDEQQFLKEKYAKVEQVVGSDDRLKKIAYDIIFHFKNRQLKGKAMIVTLSRRVAAKMYQEINKIKDAPENAVVISKNEEYKDQIQKELDNKELEKRFKNPDDALKLVIVCDMWLTGFDVPHLHTMYLDKPLKGHTLMQAVARVNRRYKDKEGGLIVDYIGVADKLKKALAIYTSDIQNQAMFPIEELIQKMKDVLVEIKEFFVDLDFCGWKKFSRKDLANLLSRAINIIITDKRTGNINKEQKRRFLSLSLQLNKIFSLCMPNIAAIEIKDDVEFIEGVRKAIAKYMVVPEPIFIDPKKETAIKELISQGIVAKGVIDIFNQSGKQKPDISILDERFLEEAKKSHLKNLTIETIKKILQDEINLKIKINIVRYRSLLEMLEKIIEEYENNVINSSKVIEKLIGLAREIRNAEIEGVEMGLTEEEKAFYDTLSYGKKSLKKDTDLKNLVKEIVKTIRRDIAIDWTNQEVIKARIRANVRLVLLKNNYPYEEVDSIIELVYEQAEALYKDFIPMVASKI
jgi:type I restriction enzyme R subunit